VSGAAAIAVQNVVPWRRNSRPRRAAARRRDAAEEEQLERPSAPPAATCPAPPARRSAATTARSHEQREELARADQRHPPIVRTAAARGLSRAVAVAAPGRVGPRGERGQRGRGEQHLLDVEREGVLDPARGERGPRGQRQRAEEQRDHAGHGETVQRPRRSRAGAGPRDEVGDEHRGGQREQAQLERDGGPVHRQTPIRARNSATPTWIGSSTMRGPRRAARAGAEDHQRQPLGALGVARRACAACGGPRKISFTSAARRPP